MNFLENRRLVVDAAKLGAADTKFVYKHSCGSEGCGAAFTLKISKKDYDEKGADKRRYKGSCSMCFKKFTLSEFQANKFTKLFGCKPSIITNNFDDVFEIE